MAENGSGSTRAGSSRNVASDHSGSDGGSVVAAGRGKRDRDLKFAVEATTTTASAGATAGGDLQILTNAMVAAEVAKKPLWVKTMDPEHLGGKGTCPLLRQPYHMVPAVIKAWVAFVHTWRWGNHDEECGLPVVLISGKGSFGRKLVVLCDSVIDYSRSEPFTVASFNALPKVMPSLKYDTSSLRRHTLQYDAFLGHAKTLMKELKDFVDAQPHNNEVEGDGRLVMKDDGWGGDTDFMGKVIQFLQDCVISHHTDVVHQILCHVKLTDDQAVDCFNLAMLESKDFRATTKHPDPPVTTMQKEVLMGLVVDPVRQLNIALKNHHVEFVRKFGTKDTVNTRMVDGDPLLHHAVMSQDLSMVKVLLEKGANVQVRGNYGGTTALHLTVTAHNAELIAKVLLENGADVDARDKYGITALHEAVIHLPVVKVLLEKGADVHVRDDMRGRTALMMAKDKPDPNPEIIALLTAAEKQKAA